MGAFGEKLRKQREQRGIALDAISNATKISTRMLRALEDEHFDQLPGGVFNKGFVRAYARQVGLDEEEAVSDYLAALRESQIQRQSILPDFRAPEGKSGNVAPPGLRPENRHNHELPSSHLPDRDLPDHDLPAKDLPTNDLPGNDLPGNNGSNQLRKEDRRIHGRRHEDRRHEDRRSKDLPSYANSTTHAPTPNPPARRFPRYPAGSPAQPADEPSARIPWGKLAVALLLLTLALVWNFRRHRDLTAAPHPALASTQSPTSVRSAASAPVSAATPPSGSSSSLTAGPPSPARALSAGTLPAGTISAVTNSSRPTPPTTTRASTTLPRAPSASATPPTAKATAPAAKPPATFTLLIRAGKTTWVSILADGKPVAHETLIAPAHTSVRASREIVVKAGNAAGISFLLNGKEIPAQGNEGEVKTYVFDATGFRVAPQTPAPAPNR